MKLDKIDWNILYELDVNSRQPLSRIAKKLRTSTEVVNYRINKLKRDDILVGTIPLIDFLNLGVIHWKICLKFQKLGPQKMEEIVADLKKENAIKWIAESHGDWDMLITCYSFSMSEVNQTKEMILNAFSGFVYDKALSFLDYADRYDREYLVQKKTRINRIRYIMQRNAIVKLDETDEKIIRLLVRDSRMSVVEIAKKIGSTARKVTYRIRNFEKQGVIIGYKSLINFEKLGIKFFKINVYLENYDPVRLRTFEQAIIQNKNCLHNGKMIANWDYEVEFEVFSEDEFQRIVDGLRNDYSDIIKRISVITITKEHKFIYF